MLVLHNFVTEQTQSNKINSHQKILKMKLTSTNFSLAFPNNSPQTKERSNQTFPLNISDLKRMMIAVFILMMFGVYSVRGQAGPMVTGTYTISSGTSFTWYDPGGAGGTTCGGSGAGDYNPNLNITETFTAANPGQKIALSWTSGSFGLNDAGDVLRVYDGPHR